ncbi:MAG: glycosyltransferase family protein [Candidatus Nealsonbacteria bacterium]|nr:glycosyltransferase family protein [Candidatus Nealsonbacteria bacterium]
MNVTAMIQARMASTRLPGKVLADIAGRSMLARVCDRVRQAETVDRIVVATGDGPSDAPVVECCRQMAVACFRGSEADVLDRFDRAAKEFRSEVVVRITADCPLIDPAVVDEVVRAFLREREGPTGCDYASNTLRRTWPRGLDTEVMTADALADANRLATEPHERTHVTPYIYQHPERFRLLPVTGREDYSDRRWTVDEPEDLDLIRAVYERLGGQTAPGWKDVRRVLADEPALARLNRHVRHKQLTEG